MLGNLRKIYFLFIFRTAEINTISMTKCIDKRPVVRKIIRHNNFNFKGRASRHTLIEKKNIKYDFQKRIIVVSTGCVIIKLCESGLIRV
jgi:hypothetical protein